MLSSIIAGFDCKIYWSLGICYFVVQLYCPCICSESLVLSRAMVWDDNHPQTNPHINTTDHLWKPCLGHMHSGVLCRDLLTLRSRHLCVFYHRPCKTSFLPSFQSLSRLITVVAVAVVKLGLRWRCCRKGTSSPLVIRRTTSGTAAK